jgi:hypothetical protein
MEPEKSEETYFIRSKTWLFGDSKGGMQPTFEIL